MDTVTWIEATAGNPQHQRLWDCVAANVADLAEQRVETRFRHLNFPSGGIRTVPGRLLNDVAILQRCTELAGESDAIVIGCWGAPTEAIRAAVDVPVTSVAEATVRVVASLAKRAVMVTVSPSLIPIFEADLAAMHASGFLADRPVRSYSPETSHDDLVAALDDPESVIARFDHVATAAVNDGADAIVVGCAYLPALFAANGYTHVRGFPDVPILDCSRLAMEHVMMLLRLNRVGVRATSRGYGAPVGVAAGVYAESMRRMGQISGG